MRQWQVLVFRRALYNLYGWKYFGVSHGDTSTVMDVNRHVALPYTHYHPAVITQKITQKA
jgi:hypothetical protein